MTPKIPFNALDRTFARHKQQLLNIYETVGLSGQFVGGEAVETFENNCAFIAQRAHGISVASATDGLYFAMLALGIGVGDTVLTAAYSYYATAEAIAKTGATPVFIDVDQNYHLDLDKAADAIEPSTRAIMVVNLFGNMVNMSEFTAFANDHNLLLIEDAAQSYGSTFKDKPSGSFGDVSVYSFDPLKQMPGTGHGGCVLTNDDDINRKVRMLAVHGRATDGRHHMLGNKSTMSSFEAAQLNYFMRIGSDFKNQRAFAANFYLLHAHNEYITMPTVNTDTEHSWHKFVIRCERRDELKLFLSQCGVQTQVHYGTLMPHEPVFGSTQSFPIAEKYASTSLSIPIYPELAVDELWHIIDCLCIFC